MGDDVTVRRLAGHDDYAACIAIQRLTWGHRTTDIVPPALLQIANKIGGAAAGAFDPDGTLLGVVYGLTGWYRGEPCHWSHFLAVHPDARDRGIGQRLKAWQRDEVRALGLSVICWTFDPLVARNAYLNVARLGARPVEYLRDLYGQDEASLTDSVIGSDRLFVRWELDESPGPPSRPEHVVALLTDTDSVEGPVFDPAWEDAERWASVAIPADVQTLKLHSPGAAQRWRVTVREALEDAFARGFRIVDVTPSPAASYVLHREES